MKEKGAKTTKSQPRSKQPYKRRLESEMTRILNEIEQGVISLKGACHKYGLNRNTLKLWRTRLAIRTLGSIHSNDLLETMTDQQKIEGLNRKIRELTGALAKADLKVIALETVIKIAEEDLQIKIRKKSGTKQSKE